MDDALEAISKIRVKNNDLWMKILDIALRSNPEETKKVLVEIKKNDLKIAWRVGEILGDDNQG